MKLYFTPDTSVDSCLEYKKGYENQFAAFIKYLE